jgi:hypothetical protein
MTLFYKKALQLFTRTQEAQIQKGLAKYPEPFNPHSWSPDELLNHALEETVDLTHYLVGLKELLDAKDKEIEDLKYLLAQEKAKVRYIPEKALVPDLSNLETKPAVIRVSKSPFEEMMEQAKRSNYPREKYDMNFNPHLEEQHERLPLNKERPSDQDDQ